MRNSTEHIETALLVMRCQDGEIEAFKELVNHWQTRLSRFVYRLTCNREAGADVTQECWLAVVRGIRKLEDPALFQGWLFRIAANKCADWIGREQRTRKTEDELGAEQKSEMIDLTGNPASTDAIDDITRLRQALRKLPQEQRTILNLRYLEGIRTEEIAALLRIPSGTVKSRLYHARNALRALIEASKTE